MLRYALLWHECPPDYRDGPHWDLMLERPGTDAEHRLATWSLLRLPTAWVAEQHVREAAGFEHQDMVRVEALPDHRASYLDYEGTVSGNRGTVARVAGGTVEWLEATADVVRVRLLGSSGFTGEVALTRSASTAWRLCVVEPASGGVDG